MKKIRERKHLGELGSIKGIVFHYSFSKKLLILSSFEQTGTIEVRNSESRPDAEVAPEGWGWLLL